MLHFIRCTFSRKLKETEQERLNDTITSNFRVCIMCAFGTVNIQYIPNPFVSVKLQMINEIRRNSSSHTWLSFGSSRTVFISFFNSVNPAYRCILVHFCRFQSLLFDAHQISLSFKVDEIVNEREKNDLFPAKSSFWGDFQINSDLLLVLDKCLLAG